MFSSKYLKEVSDITNLLKAKDIEAIVEIILKTKKKKGRIFFLGVGGSAANSSHAVNDFRKIVNIECYAPTDNIAEFTARTNDEGWEYTFSEWLKISNLSNKDLLFIFSVGGGNKAKNVSINIVKAIDLAINKKVKIIGVVGKDSGYTAKKADKTIIIPTVNKHHITPHSESFQSIIWHLLVSHPKLKENKTKWESI